MKKERLLYDKEYNYNLFVKIGIYIDCKLNV